MKTDFSIFEHQKCILGENGYAENVQNKKITLENMSRNIHKVKIRGVREDSKTSICRQQYSILLEIFCLQIEVFASSLTPLIFTL